MTMPVSPVAAEPAAADAVGANKYMMVKFSTLPTCRGRRGAGAAAEARLAIASHHPTTLAPTPAHILPPAPPAAAPSPLPAGLTSPPTWPRSAAARPSQS